MTPIETLHAYAAAFPDEGEMAARSLDLLQQASGDVMARATVPAHITASLIVLSEDTLLTIWHPYLKMWIQPGGHVDPGEAPLQATLREAVEETGLFCDLHPWHTDKPIPYDIDCLPVPENPVKGEVAHWHIDFRYVLVPRADTPVSAAELKVRYVPLIELGALTPSLARLTKKLSADKNLFKSLL